MSDTIARCFECREPVDTQSEGAVVELNPNGTGAVGFHLGKLCPDCEAEAAEKMKQTTGGNV